MRSLTVFCVFTVALESKECNHLLPARFPVGKLVILNAIAEYLSFRWWKDEFPDLWLLSSLLLYLSVMS